MFGGIAIRNQLLCHGFSDSRGRVRLLDLRTGEEKGQWSFGGGKEGFADVGGLTMDRDANIYVADPEGGLVRRFSVFGNRAGELVTNQEQKAAGRVFSDKRGVIDHPNDVALDGDGNLYICSGDRPLRHGVQSFDAQGKFRFACRAFGEPLEEWGIPMGITFVRDQLYIADTFNQCIQILAKDGGFRMMFSTNQEQGRISYPVAVAVKADGDILVAQWKDRPAILAFNSSGWFMDELIGPGKEEGQVHGPAALALDEQENIYVLDRSGERLQQFDPKGRLVRGICKPAGQ